jgi:hypothetical protein
MLLSCGGSCRAKRPGAESTGPEHRAASRYKCAASIEKRSGTPHHSGQLSALAAEEKPVYCAATNWASSESPSRECASCERAVVKFPVGQRGTVERTISESVITWHNAARAGAI